MLQTINKNLVGDFKTSQLKNISIISISQKFGEIIFSRFSLEEKAFYKTKKFDTGEVLEIGYKSFESVFNTLDSFSHLKYNIVERDNKNVLRIS